MVSRRQALPIALTVLLVGWTAVVYRTSTYGDWTIWPAILVLPIAAVVHMVLVAQARDRARQLWYAGVHLVLLGVIWIICLMLISKDLL